MTRLIFLTLVVALASYVPIHAQPKDPPKNFTNSLGMKFVWIPPGNFMMGSPKEEKERGTDEADETQHKVTLTKGFYMGVHFVTQEQWQAVMGNNPSFFKGDKNLPVENVSWEDCQEFIKKIREKDKKPYRLPTEAQWEYACRAGSTTPFYFGETISTDQANYNGNYSYGNGKRGVYRKKPTPVGVLSANAWGLHDMHGNVWQYCQDWYGYYPIKDAVDPQGPNTGKDRVLRGGSWGFEPEFCRSAARRRYEPGNRNDHCGFRLCFCLEVAESTNVTAAWLKEVAAMPAEKQAAEVAAKLKELNPGFDGKVTHKIEKGEVTELTFVTNAVKDISPVQALTGLRTLVCSSMQIADLSPLKDMKLTTLNCAATKVADLLPLKDMKLTSLICNHTEVSDLSPLKDMRLKHLICNHTKVGDLSPLKDMKLEYLDCGYTPVADLSLLKDMKLTTLNCAATQIADLSSLKDMKLTTLNCAATNVADLSPLKDMKLTNLLCGLTQVADLLPLKDMKLTHLDCSYSKVADLSALKGMKLTSLFCNNTEVADLSPLKNMKLTILLCEKTKVSDLSPLKQLPLQELSCDFMSERDAEILRSIKTLENINGQPAKEVLKENPPKDFMNSIGLKSGIKELQGKWRAVEMQTGGNPAPKEVLEKARLEIKNDEWIWLSGGPVDRKSRIRLDPSKSPKEIDVTMLDGPAKGSTFPGIYALEKGQLRVCYSHTKDPKERPKDFKTERGQLRELLVLERVLADDAEDKAAHEAEKLFRDMEQKVRAAKTLQIRFDAIITGPEVKIKDDKKKADAKNWHVKGSLILGEGDNYRAEYEGNLFGQETKHTFVSDGAYWTSFGYTKRSGEAKVGFRGTGTERTPKAIGAYLRPALPRDGFVLCFVTDRRSQLAPDHFIIADFKLAGEEKIGERNTQVIQYTVKAKAKDPSFGTPNVNVTTMKLSMKVWLDTKTKLPVKLAMTCGDSNFNAITETYAEFTVDAKVDAKLFELPK